MKARARRRERPLAAMAACLAIGVSIGWWLRATGGPKPVITGIPGAIDGPTAEGPPAGGHDRDENAPPSVVSGAGRTDKPVATAGTPPNIAALPRGAEPGGPVEQLQRRHLRVPIDGLDVDTLKGGFSEHRAGDG